MGVGSESGGAEMFQDSQNSGFRHRVGLAGLEPATSSLSGMRSNHLSYRPVVNDAELYNTRR